MYIARKKKLVIGRGNVRLPGDPVPEAKSWPERQRRAYINLGLLEEVPDEPKKERAKAKPKSRSKKQNKQETKEPPKEPAQDSVSANVHRRRANPRKDSAPVTRPENDE